MSAVAEERGASMRRMRALGRAEMTLLARSRAALFVALALPVALTVSLQRMVPTDRVEDAGLSVGTAVLPGSVGLVLLFAVYTNLMGVYVARREELVLKRLRTGQAREPEILGAAALPAAAVGLAQAVVLMAGGAVALDVGAPERPDLLVAGLVLGVALMAVLAAVTAMVTRTTELAQLTGMPLMLVSLVGSGMFIPLEIAPDQVAAVCRALPLTPVMDLLRGGWTGRLGVAETLRALVTALSWIALGVFAVRRWFRWEPRR
ncbi:ABC transporter permease [Streptomyces boncukensis]|uniref:ABC transporter permease n=1 Tax=Streptomyces boncukensis TaxID=2711219 RepID=A0A6G4WY12_9ACTN|nr:ABC transporter permease [Streptomyces boncukensis]NGO70176.1 ABC transporter permease [Streptomyces boncukensis]